MTDSGEEESGESEEEESGSKKKSKIKNWKKKHPKKKEDFVEMAAFKYSVEDKLHPFHALNGVVRSIDIKNIISAGFNKDLVSDLFYK